MKGALQEWLSNFMVADDSPKYADGSIRVQLFGLHANESTFPTNNIACARFDGDHRHDDLADAGMGT